MKKKLLSISALAILLTISASTIRAQYSWSQDTNFLGAARAYDVGFSIGHYGYVGCGAGASIYYNDFWRWNQNTNTWTAIAGYPGLGYKYCPTAFSIEGKGYVGLGNGISGMEKDLWSYDTAANTWTQMANFPGTPRYAQSVFVVGHKAYIVGGSIGGPPYLSDVWMYDAHQNTWTQMNNSPAGNMETMVTFTIGNQGYIGGGYDGTSDHTGFWKYDTANDSWISIASFPLSNGLGGCPSAFVLGTKAYVCMGGIGNNSKLITDGYTYDTVTKAWAVFTNMETNGIERGYGVAFSIGNIGYIATGRDSLGNLLNSLWQYSDTSVATGIQQLHSSENISLYPNPSNGMINLVYDGTVLKGKFQITDLTGRIIDSYEMTGSKGQMTINETGLTNGMYFYQVIDSGNIATSGKFIIAK